MTFERASEIVSTVCNSDCDNQVCYDLFDHFVTFFNINIDDDRFFIFVSENRKLGFFGLFLKSVWYESDSYFP